MKIEYSEEAAADLAEATGWYGSSRIGFDEVFLAAVIRAETLIFEHPLAAPAWPDIPEQARIRRALISGFPNALAFRIEGSASVSTAGSFTVAPIVLAQSEYYTGQALLLVPVGGINHVYLATVEGSTDIVDLGPGSSAFFTTSGILMKEVAGFRMIGGLTLAPASDQFEADGGYGFVMFTTTAGALVSAQTTTGTRVVLSAAAANPSVVSIEGTVFSGAGIAFVDDAGIGWLAAQDGTILQAIDSVISSRILSAGKDEYGHAFLLRIRPNGYGDLLMVDIATLTSTPVAHAPGAVRAHFRPFGF